MTLGHLGLLMLFNTSVETASMSVLALERCLLLRQDRCLLLRQDRCLLLRQDKCKIVRQGSDPSY